MRLDDQELSAIKAAISGEEVREVYLFGSRADDSKRGGDIDLLVYSQERPFDLSLRISSRFFAECEEKIDVVVVDPNNLTANQSLFIEEIFSQNVVRIL